jgi:hypothetical protein
MANFHKEVLKAGAFAPPEFVAGQKPEEIYFEMINCHEGRRFLPLYQTSP